MATKCIFSDYDFPIYNNYSIDRSLRYISHNRFLYSMFLFLFSHFMSLFAVLHWSRRFFGAEQLIEGPHRWSDVLQTDLRDYNYQIGQHVQNMMENAMDANIQQPSNDGCNWSINNASLFMHSLPSIISRWKRAHSNVSLVKWSSAVLDPVSLLVYHHQRSSCPRPRVELHPLPRTELPIFKQLTIIFN